MMRCIGVTRREGVYDGRNYDNVYLHCVVPPGEMGGVNVIGSAVEQVKVAFQVLINCGLSMDDCVDRDIEIAYDRYGRVRKVDILSEV